MNAPQPLKRPAVDRGARAAVKSGGNLCWPWIYRLREASSRSVASRVAVLGRSGIVAQLVEAMDRADPINRTYEGRAMNDWKLPWDGGCLCGVVRFRVSAPPLLTMACHCTGCQKLSASAYSLIIAVPSDGFAVTRGELVTGGLHGPHRQLYCPHLQELDVHTPPWPGLPCQCSRHHAGRASLVRAFRRGLHFRKAAVGYDVCRAQLRHTA